MSTEDGENTDFHTDHGTFCYQNIPFGLKNIGAMYQQLMDKVFADQIRQNVEFYVDHMVIKNRDKAALIRDIEETFRTLAQVQMKLIPGKCTFRVEERQFLGYQITRQGTVLNQAMIHEFFDSKFPTVYMGPRDQWNVNGAW